MWTATVADLTRYDDAIRRAHTRRSKATFRNLVTGESVDLELKDGDVTEDGNANVRRSLTCTLPASELVWQSLDTVGGEITVEQTLRYTDGQSDTVPLMVAILVADEYDYGPDGSLSISSAPDRWNKVQNSKLPLGQRTSVRSNTIPQEIKRLVEGAWNTPTYPFPGWSQFDTSVTDKVGGLVYDGGDREAPIMDMLRAHSLECFFDRQGLAVLRLEPVITSTTQPLALINAGDTGIMVGARRTRDRSKVKNAIEVETSAPDVQFPTQEVASNDPTNPLSTAGPLGRQSETYSSPLLRSSAQARKAGATRLAKTMAVGLQLTIETSGYPLLDAGDPDTIALPQVDVNTPRPTELHLIDVVSHPLAPQGTQSITTRSTRPDDADGGA